MRPRDLLPRRRVHAGCGIRNPWLKWIWITLALAYAISFPVDLLTGSLWGMAGYLPWVLANAGMAWWEKAHPPPGMYRSWHP